MMRCLRLVTLATAAAAVLALASPPLVRRVVVSQTIDMAGDEVPVSPGRDGARTFVMSGPARCDGHGNMYLVPHLGGATASLLLRITPQGTRRIVDLPAVLNAEVRVSVVATDASSNIHVLGLVGPPREDLRQVVTLDGEGRHLRTRDIDESSLVATAFAPFATGEVLLVGIARQTGVPAAAVLAAGTPSARAVSLPWGRAKGFQVVHTAAGPSGLVFVAPDKGGILWTVSAAGDVVRTVALAGPPVTDATLVGLLASGSRVAATFHGSAEGGALDRWVVVHDAGSGAHVATYGPMNRPVTCFTTDGSTDRFTLLSIDGGRWQLLQVSAG